MNSTKNISIIGVGRLGLCLSLNLERFGYNVIGIDVDKDYILKLNNKTYDSAEPFVNNLLKNSKNFNVYFNIKECFVSDIIFIIVPTPSINSGKYNHENIDKIINELILFGIQTTTKYLVISSTVYPGYCDEIYNKIKNYNYELIYNPEFIAQGSIINDQLSPDIILIGSYSKNAGNLLETIYKKMCKNDPIICKMAIMEAEIAKIALNCYITTKISYANMVGDILKKFNLNPDIVLNSIGLDKRIGNICLKYGFGFGGPCFPRDNKAFGLFCEENGVYPHISYATDKSNQSHLIYQINDFVRKNPDKNKEIVFESVTYKPNVDIIEESQKLKFIDELQKMGYKIVIKDIDKVICKLKKIYGHKFKYIIK